jgi:acetyl-CoA synthetase
MQLKRDATSYDELCRTFRWEVPVRYNIAWECCGRWAQDRGRFALYFEDDAGETSAWTFWDIQREANRLSNVLGALGTQRHDRVAIILPQRPETGVAHIACYQMGAIAVPLSHLFGPDALEYRLRHAEARVAIVDRTSLPNLLAIRDRLPGLRHVIGVGGARESGIHEWSGLLAHASARYACLATSADDPALIIYTSGTTGEPKGALMAHRTLLGNLPGFVCSHDFFPHEGDMFWSPADWAWTGGLFDALLPTWSFGLPILGYCGRFEAERALYLIEKYAVRNCFLFPTALKLLMKNVPEPKMNHDIGLRTIMSGGEPVGTAVFDWAREQLGVTINEIFGQTEMNYVVGGCAALYPPKPGAMGRAYPGHRVAVLGEEGEPLPPGELGEIAVQRACGDEGDPVLMLEYWKNPQASAEKFFGTGPQAWGMTGDLAKVDGDGYLWYQGRADDMFKSAGYRIGPSEIENCLLRYPLVAMAAVIGVPDETRGTLVKAFIVLQPDAHGTPELEDELRQHVRQHLAPYQYPKAIEFVDALPMTTSGKIQRRLLRLRETQGRNRENP